MGNNDEKRKSDQLLIFKRESFFESW